MNALNQKDNNFMAFSDRKIVKNNRLSRYLSNAPENAGIFPFSGILGTKISGYLCIFAVLLTHSRPLLPLYRKQTIDF